ncbi:MAG TPA: short-chain dehydrogenase [Deltaproteobacteria bacterium]|jgi:benzil reductase ((S)-benzoin forming)|nr:SDR family NAD(P)-dependent oxidoreductase [Pseudomonadota bacterium]RZO47053.1 MAG: SDR family NAD(P)-dependent oxidoreductase [Pseudomonadota bacterium]HBM54567.1 short-chain dehydrogenase [Deltaproteobacteria bacterium]|tara:strand:+ start:361 stop:1113 length:753 start_codon:yes stop_codon:yes gene_type:complete
MMKHILITGGGTGIGRALAGRFADKGWRVTIVGRRLNLLQEVARDYPDKISIISADVGSIQDRQKIVSEAKGTLDLLVHNAAVLGPVGPILDQSPEDWKSHMATNVEGPLFLTQALLLKLVENSRVVNISSGAAHQGIPGWGMYCTSKAALFMLGQLLKDELAQRNIWFGSVRPGIVDTPMQAEIRALEPKDFPMVEQFRQYKATGALVTSELVAQYLEWLLLEVSGPQLGEREWDIRDAEWQSAWQKLA